MQNNVTHIKINGKIHDCLIVGYMTAKKDENGDVIWTNEKNDLIYTKGRVSGIKVYMLDSNNYEKATVLDISPESIKQLYGIITEIEAMEGEDFMDY